MRQEVQQLSAAKVAREYPLADLVEGWYFKVEEMSAGAYRAEGTDLWGRRVSYSGPDPNEALTKCAEYARGVIAQAKDVAPGTDA
jgi:hypothetical protein